MICLIMTDACAARVGAFVDSIAVLLFFVKLILYQVSRLFVQKNSVLTSLYIVNVNV